MYKSKIQIERKLNQVKFSLLELDKFKNRMFLYNGMDKVTGCYPLHVRLITFIILARSIFQYAHKEAKKDSRKLQLYEAFVAQKKIIPVFKDLRDTEIHSLTCGVYTEVTGNSPIETFNHETGEAIGKATYMFVESLDDLNTPKPRDKDIDSYMEVHHQISKVVKITSELLAELIREGKQDLVDAANLGHPLYETIEFEGKSDLFELCQLYYESIESLIEYGIKNEFIT